jgi:hypothetical protein
MNSLWKNILRRFGHDCKGFAMDEEVAKISKPVVEKTSNFKLDMDEDDNEELLETVPEELTNVELLELEQEHTGEEEAREKETAEEEKEPLRKFTVKGLEQAFADLNKLLKKFENMDPNTERFSLIERNVYSALSAYKQIYDEKKKQTKHTTMGVFLKRVTPQEQPQAGPSGCIPEEGIVIHGDDSSMHVIAPENPPVGQDVEVEDSDTDDPDPM